MSGLVFSVVEIVNKVQVLYSRYLTDGFFSAGVQVLKQKCINADKVAAAIYFLHVLSTRVLSGKPNHFSVIADYQANCKVIYQLTICRQKVPVSLMQRH